MASTAANDGTRPKSWASLTNEKFQTPPSPPETVKDVVSSTDSSTDSDVGESLLSPNYQSHAYPLPPQSRPSQSVLPVDVKTPDAHVERDPRLIRLTGVHPFNVEPPLTDLWNEGFLTSKDLHYVRNHGAVPLVLDDDVADWTFTVEGLVENPLTLTLRDLLADFEQVTYPVTLVCAGNRRKEQNLVRKTKGFSWGAAGVSTALWTGVPLDVLLARAKPITRGRHRRARYVCFEGADQLPNGPYGTSIKLAWATDPAYGVLLAHGMNGEALTPDHGRPLRVVIPGQIGGRSVKWLRRIVVTEDPSDSWYHIYDNRVLPTTVSPEASADLPDVWRDERYAIYELNVNSAMARPAHEERVRVRVPDGDGEEEGKDKRETSCVKFQGYAYAGGGRRVTRVEVTLDRGRSWRLAELSYPEDAYRAAPEGEMLFGGRLDVEWRETSFCWCFWTLDIIAGDLGNGATDVMVRAMDEAMMVQPRDMYWSVLGMMNNPWYRVVVHREEDEDGVATLRFEHPAQPALMPGGWMERVKKEGGDLSNGYWGERMGGEAEGERIAPEPVKEIVMTSADVKREIDLEDLKKHDGETEPWFVLDGEVYDGTKFLEGHPGGAASIVGAAGLDVSEEFMAIHSENAKAMMPAYHIGTLDGPSRKLLASGEALEPPSSEPRPVFLHPKRWQKALLTIKTPVSHDSKIFTFSLEHPQQQLGLPVGQHLLLRLRDPATREALIRAYTPISSPSPSCSSSPSEDDDNDTAAAEEARGRLDVLIKIYSKGVMTQALDALPIGHGLEVKGPVGKFEYLGRGVCAIAGRGQEVVSRFVMVCAGSGITPILAVLRAVLTDDGDATECTVLDGNRSEEDILCREEMETLLTSRGRRVRRRARLGGGGVEHRCRIVHTLTRPGPGWTGGRGRLDRALFEREAGPPPAPAPALSPSPSPPLKSSDGEAGHGAGALVLVCGPEAMEHSVRESFVGMGWREEDLLFF